MIYMTTKKKTGSANITIRRHYCELPSSYTPWKTNAIWLFFFKSTVEELGSQTRFSVFEDQTAFTNAQFVSFPYCNMSTGKILALAVNQLLLLRRYQNICLTSLPISSRACALCERARQSFTMCLFSTVLLFYFHKRYLQLTRLDDWADISLEAFGVTSQRVVSHAASCETSLVLGECLYEEGTGTRQPHTHTHTTVT